MTTIAILGGDFEVLLADETTGTAGTNAGLRLIRRASGATETVYETRTLYSAVAEVTDDFIAMGFKNPMLPTTPNAYTMENYYYIPRSACEYLKEGAITADWSLAAPNGDTDGNGVIRKEYTVGLGTDFISTDIGKQIVESASGDTGTLLDYEVDPDGTLVAWIRPNDSTPATGDIFDSTTGTISVTADGGTGSVDVAIAGTSGITQYSAIQAIGSVPTATEVYVVQDRNKLADATTNTFQWWDTDTEVSLGIISILVRVRNSGTLIADGDVEVFARRYTSLYDNFRLNVAGGGFSALPLASAPDINNTTGYLSAVLSGSTGTWDIGSGIYVGASWAAATAKGVITSGGTGGTPTLEYYLVGDLTTIDNTDTVTEYVFATGLDGDASGTINGVPGATSGGPTDSASGEGGTVTVALGETLQDYDNDAVNEPYSITINAQGNVPVAKVYERLKYLTRRGEQTDPFTGGPFNIPGETYRGLDATLEYDAATGTLTDGEDVFITLPVAKTNFSARLIARCNTFTTTHVTLTDIQTSLTSAQPADNDVLEDSTGTDDVTLHAGGTEGLSFYTSPKSSPFGTFTGSQLFVARGIYVSSPAGPDTQNYILTDNLGNLRSPPNTVAFTVENTRAGDRILVARDTTTLGVIDKDQFGGIATGTLAASTITVTGSIDGEVPPSGFVRVVSTAAGTALLQEHHYVYDSRTTGASGVFTLRPDAAGTGITTADTADANGDASIIDTTATFQTDNVEIGMLVRNTTTLKTTHVWEVTAITSETQLEVRQLYGPKDATQDWDISDTYTINTLIGDHTVPGNYSTSDNLYDLILDVEETVGTDGSPGSESNTFIQSTTFNVVVNVRQGKVILPFTQNAGVGASGGSVTVVRSEDTIAV
jgi:hypothetical protein